MSKELDIAKDEGRYRFLRELNGVQINFSSNDYISIASDLDLQREFFSQYKNLLESTPMFSSSSSRLITGNYPLIAELESELAKIYERDAIVFNSGYDGNTTILETIVSKDTLVLTDRLNHASIYNGIINSKVTSYRYRHLNMEHLRELLEKYSGQYKEILVVTETIYSMDGDCVDLQKLVNLKKEFGFKIFLDEAHSFGVYGYGLAYKEKLHQEIDFLFIPLGKGGGSIGAYLICDTHIKEYLVNFAKGFIYTTALPPINIAWNLFILKKIPQMEGRIEKLRAITEYFYEKLEKYQVETAVKLNIISTTHIIPIIIPKVSLCNKIAESMRAKDILVFAIKEPTVPKNTSRLRISLNSNITKGDVDRFFEVLKDELNNLL